MADKVRRASKRNKENFDEFREESVPDFGSDDSVESKSDRDASSS